MPEPELAGRRKDEATEGSATPHAQQGPAAVRAGVGVAAPSLEIVTEECQKITTPEHSTATNICKFATL